MSYSFQTNVTSLVAQQNLDQTQQMQSKTIEQLTSGYRINSSADDAAGLAVANGYRSNIAELTQGVQNANQGINQLQIIDGGLSNISQILNRMSTLATESATSTFTGDRGTLNTEYSGLVSEINRQAANIQLNAGGAYNAALAVFIGGATQAASDDASVSVDLSGQANGVDAVSLGLDNSSVLGGGNVISSPGALNLNTAPTILSAGGTQSFLFHYTNSGGADATLTASVVSVAGGISVSDALGQLNSQLSGLGINASVSSAGNLQFSGDRAFSATATGLSVDDGLISNSGSSTVENQSLYRVIGAVPSASAQGEQFSLVGSNNQTIQITLGPDATAQDAVTDINTTAGALGITASVTSSGAVELSSTSAFTMVETAAAAGGQADSIFNGGTVGNVVVNAPVAATSETGNAQSALTAVQNAVEQLGLVQGVVGAGENKLNYAINLAQSQIANYSAAESTIRDADVAADATRLTQAQVLQQASIAALAQANSAPQALLKLFQQ
jgi:flagellin